MTVLALDIGGTKFAAAHVAADGTLLARAERPPGPDPAATLRRLVGDFAAPGLTAAGIGAAGPLDAGAGTVSPVNIRAWRDFPIVQDVHDRLGDLPVALAGDAQCMAVGEWWVGGHGAASLLGIVVSTGVGAGLVLRGTPELGAAGNAGHLGHIVVDPAGGPCACGARGCLETVASGPGMVRWALAQGWTPERGDGEASAQALADAARGGASVPLAAFDRAADALALAVRTATALLDVPDVVIGGGVSAAGDLLLPALRDRVARSAGLSFLREPRISLTSLERDAGLYGATALALRATGVRLHPRTRRIHL
ncbi:ROK family protein [Spirillospora sp. NPDC048819]|uniref:ROK family protein n=1 Tax=Spirillospora sp. NPDC048819 TaxID=3155268 RepID=UPI0033E6B72C